MYVYMVYFVTPTNTKDTYKGISYVTHIVKYYYIYYIFHIYYVYIYIKYMYIFTPLCICMYRYISLIYRGAGYSPECNIIALVFLNRITTMHTIPLTAFNWRALWLITVILSQKVWDDKPLKTSAFTTILPSISRKCLRDMETKALELLQYMTSVKPSLYAKYYFELRQLFTEIMGFQDKEWNILPLTILGAKKLEYKSKLCQQIYNKSTTTNNNNAVNNSKDKSTHNSFNVNNSNNNNTTNNNNNTNNRYAAAPSVKPILITTASTRSARYGSNKSLSWSDDEEGKVFEGKEQGPIEEGKRSSDMKDDYDSKINTMGTKLLTTTSTASSNNLNNTGATSTVSQSSYLTNSMLKLKLTNNTSNNNTTATVATNAHNNTLEDVTRSTKSSLYVLS